jgi:hypothetical protein
MIDYILEVCYNNNIVVVYMKALLYITNFKMPKLALYNYPKGDLYG